jgi:Spy/CpxP family protein refolding chaperone
MMAWWKWKQSEHGHHHHEHGHDRGHGYGHHDRGERRGERGCGPHDGGEGMGEVFVGSGGDPFDDGGGSFGVRRPLRFLAHRLDLDEKQIGDLAYLLSELKTERAQAAVDHRRTVAGFADVIAGEAFDEGQAATVAAERVKSAERLRDALVKALGRIHALLHPDQRAKFAYLIRTGALTL